MHRPILVVFAFALSCDAHVAAAQPARSAALTDGQKAYASELNWTSKPSAADLLAAYPPRALQLGASGKVVIRCTATAQGQMQDCEVISEKPTRRGFGEAALKLAPRYSVAPTTSTGDSSTGASITIPINFVTN